jgi:hypothetical protein
VFNFMHTAAGFIAVFVWQAGTNSDPNAVYGLLGTNGGASANIGSYIVYDDRISSARNNRVVFLNTRGSAFATGLREVVFSDTADNVHPANAPVILTIISNPAASVAADRLVVRINGSAVTATNTFTNPASSANASFPFQIGACGNGALPLTDGRFYGGAIFPLSAGLATAINAEGFLAGPVAGFGLQGILAADHPFKFFPPTI